MYNDRASAYSLACTLGSVVTLQGVTGTPRQFASNSTALSTIEPPTLDEYIATLHASVPDGAPMRTTLQVSGRPAEVLLDTGTVGTNLMSLVWAQAVTPCRVTTLPRAQARLYAKALSLYMPHNDT